MGAQAISAQARYDAWQRLVVRPFNVLRRRGKPPETMEALTTGFCTGQRSAWAAYAQQHAVQALLHAIAQQLLIKQPPEPLGFLAELLSSMACHAQHLHGDSFSEFIREHCLAEDGTVIAATCIVSVTAPGGVATAAPDECPLEVPAWHPWILNTAITCVASSEASTDSVFHEHLVSPSSDTFDLTALDEETFGDGEFDPLASPSAALISRHSTGGSQPPSPSGARQVGLIESYLVRLHELNIERNELLRCLKACWKPWPLEESAMLRRSVRRVLRRNSTDKSSLWDEVSAELGCRGPRECKLEYARTYKSHRGKHGLSIPRNPSADRYGSSTLLGKDIQDSGRVKISTLGLVEELQSC